MTAIRVCAAWIAAELRSFGAGFDPDVVQWPGGSLIAILLWAVQRRHR